MKEFTINIDVVIKAKDRQTAIAELLNILTQEFYFLTLKKDLEEQYSQNFLS